MNEPTTSGQDEADVLRRALHRMSEHAERLTNSNREKDERIAELDVLLRNVTTKEEPGASHKS